jgi:hypothetical protein
MKHIIKTLEQRLAALFTNNGKDASGHFGFCILDSTMNKSMNVLVAHHYKGQNLAMMFKANASKYGIKIIEESFALSKGGLMPRGKCFTVRLVEIPKSKKSRKK